ncbi:hypothetical protein DOTSEDRAFT_85899 [Dothistroma septosporum NZE10]|uniref:Uncharacterized protein n=1 Tax=Dothistroma septosporum (strain NZE10 / CBS 128990) TaxID=675120 RepID=N1PWM9_DOTSN|nr:hypothetical protein DOTSEDRAFT_85899 [Dothistroma septosporum NZE10]
MCAIRADAGEFEESNLYIVDRRGDAKNVEYGSLHRYSIPAYHSIGYGNVVGLSPQAKIDREASNEKTVVLTAANRKNRTRLPRLLTGKHGRSHETRLRHVFNASDAPTDLESDYVKLRPTQRRKRGSKTPEAIDHRSIEGKAKAHEQPVDEDLDFASDSQPGDSGDALELQARQQNAVLSKATKGNPEDLDAWLALSEHQATMVHAGAELMTFTFSERRALADLRLSILHQAASHIKKGHPGRDQLLLATIEEGSIIWASTRASSRWKDILAECPGSILLWTKYLDHIQERYPGFQYDECKASFLQCMRVLREASARPQGNEQGGIARLQVYSLLRLTTFVRDAGYSEVAVAAWQALLEYHFFAPADLIAATVDEKLEHFESFWDSEVPRIGEENAEGWNRHRESGDCEARTSASSRPASSDLKCAWASFAELEATLSEFRLPASADDDDAVADPFRCVMFSDIREILESMGTGLHLPTLADGFLAFLELPARPCIGVDDGINMSNLDSHTAEYGAFRAAHLLRLPHDTASELRQCRETTESLFAQENSAFEVFREKYGMNERYENIIRFADRSLAALVAINKHDDVLAEYYLAFKVQLLPDEAAKLAKKQLKERSSSLRLYNAYALIETRLGREQKADSVWCATLGMRSGIDSTAPDDAVLLWHSRTLSTALGSTASALPYLLSIVNEQSETWDDQAGNDNQSVQCLKVMRKLQEGFDRMMLGSKHAHAALYADLLAWLAYLNSSYDLDETFRAYEKCSTPMSRQHAKLGLELLQQYKAGFVKHHIKLKRPYKPAALRREIDDSLSLFPNNSILIDLARQLATQDRLRTLVHDQKSVGPAQRSIVQWVSKITEELQRTADTSSGSTVNTVRATFTSALLSLDSKVKHAPALWFMWLRFECNQASSRSSEGVDAYARAKQVFLDGIRYLPWHKHWAIAGMAFFSERGSSEVELRQLHDTLVERGLRLRLDVEGALS